VPGDARRGRHKSQQVVREIHRLNRAEPQALDVCFTEDRPNQIRQTHRARAMLSAPPAEVDAAQNHLAIPSAEMAHLFQHLRQRRTAAPAAHLGNDAKRAAIVAPVLDFQDRAGVMAGGVANGR
jgi:hypothetical protein